MPSCLFLMGTVALYSATGPIKKMRTNQAWHRYECLMSQSDAIVSVTASYYSRCRALSRISRALLRISRALLCLYSRSIRHCIKDTMQHSWALYVMCRALLRISRALLCLCNHSIRHGITDTMQHSRALCIIKRALCNVQGSFANLYGNI